MKTGRNYYTATQLAKILQVDYYSVKEAIEKGQIRARRYAGGWYRISEEEVQRILNKYGIDPNEEYLRPSQIARMLGVVPDTVVYWIRTGKLHAVKNLTGYYLVPRTEVERFLKESNRKPREKN